MHAWMTVGLLIIANVFMTFAWYGHLKLTQMKVISADAPLFIIILISWGIALIEYCFMIPANRAGYIGNGGHFSLMQLKVMQEVITLSVFMIFTLFFFKNEPMQWNHFAAFCCLILAVYFVFWK